jgi:Protein of unknown function (DUF3800)
MYCFCDDSGKESDASNPIVVMAGYLFPDMNALAAFDSMWKGQLLRHGISWLHMKDFMQDQDEYAKFAKDWPRKKALLETFINVIKSCQPIGFGIGVDMNGWRKIPRSIQRIEGDAQMFCFTRMMRMVVDRMVTAAPRDSVALVFDCDLNFSSARFNRFIAVRQRLIPAAKHLEAFTIAEPKRYLQIQAADLLAWETRKAMERNTKGFPSRPEFDHFFTDIAGIFPEYVGEEWGEEKLQRDFVVPLMATGEYEPDL